MGLFKFNYTWWSNNNNNKHNPPTWPASKPNYKIPLKYIYVSYKFYCQLQFNTLQDFRFMPFIKYSASNKRQPNRISVYLLCDFNNTPFNFIKIAITTFDSVRVADSILWLITKIGTRIWCPKIPLVFGTRACVCVCETEFDDVDLWLIIRFMDDRKMPGIFIYNQQSKCAFLLHMVIFFSICASFQPRNNFISSQALHGPSTTKMLILFSFAFENSLKSFQEMNENVL